MSEKAKRPLKPELRKALLAGKLYGGLFILLLTGMALKDHLAPDLPHNAEQGLIVLVTAICFGIAVRLAFLARPPAGRGPDFISN